ncbi:MAG: thioredoxin [Helicobacteraceae bacterium]|nr:thioredoxin [Helicobacteraceae bacterium]
MSNALELATEGFDQAIENGISLVDFWAPWCGPCRMLAPIIDSLAEDCADNVKVCKVNVDENPDLAARFGIRTVPTILFFKDGEQKDMLIGVNAKTAFEDKLQGLL